MLWFCETSTLYYVLLASVIPLTPTVAIWVQLQRNNSVPDRVKPSFVIFDIHSGHSDARCMFVNL